GNRRQRMFFCDEDYGANIGLLADWMVWQRVASLLEIAPDSVTLLSTELSDTECEALRHERTDRPLGDDDFITRLEWALGRSIRRQKPVSRGSTREPTNCVWCFRDSYGYGIQVTSASSFHF
ncbi:MAG: hypothetical protein AB1733_24985, partial [Thermodesulfobacteriota bacterium]